MFRVKICGVTREADAVAVADAGADAIGLNFYERSPRRVTTAAAASISAAVGPAVLRVGVFVNAPAAEIERAVGDASLDAVQLHGDEPASLLADLPAGVPVVRASRVGEAGLAPIARQLAKAADAGRPYAAVLLDAAAPGNAYGGSGRVADWARIDAERSLLGSTPLILAGGLKPENVGEAIAAVRPSGVDTASGVELGPGEKDEEQVRRFVTAALRGLAD